MFSRLFSLTGTQDCYFCGATCNASLCDGCSAALPRLPAARCPCCALPAPESRHCGRCLSEEPHYDTTAAALAYGYPLDAAIQAFKYRNALGLTRSFVALMDQAIGQPPRIDLVIPTPLSQPHLAERGYNQAHELARGIAQRRRLPLDAQALIRHQQGPAQAQLPWKERAKNIRGAFSTARRFDSLHVAVVDDVMTTGATLNEMAKTLKKAGAAQVSNWVLARTLPAVMNPVKA